MDQTESRQDQSDASLQRETHWRPPPFHDGKQPFFPQLDGNSRSSLTPQKTWMHVLLVAYASKNVLFLLYLVPPPHMRIWPVWSMYQAPTDWINVLHCKRKEMRRQSVKSSCYNMLLPIFFSDLTPRSISTLCHVSHSSNAHYKAWA